jgi:hypothetical protein
MAMWRAAGMLAGGHGMGRGWRWAGRVKDGADHDAPRWCTCRAECRQGSNPAV